MTIEQPNPQQSDKPVANTFLQDLYGENVYNEVLVHLQELATGSNFAFTQEFIGIGASFMQIHAEKILKGEEEKVELKKLVGNSFFEASIYWFNVRGEK